MPPSPHSTATPTALPPVTVVVEVLMISADQGGLRFRTLCTSLRDEHPDVVARSLAELPSGRCDGLLHSTSWRFTNGRLTVTYVGLPDPRPAASTTPIVHTPVLGSADPLAPSPAQIEPVDVAVHACRHLAFLRQTDPTVAAAADAAPTLWELIAEFTPAVAGTLTPPTAPSLVPTV